MKSGTTPERGPAMGESSSASTTIKVSRCASISQHKASRPCVLIGDDRPLSSETWTPTSCSFGCLTMTSRTSGCLRSSRTSSRTLRPENPRPYRVEYRIPVLTAMLSVGVRIAALAQGAPLAITDVTVVDGTGDGSRPHLTVVVSGGRIIAVDPVARAVIPPQATVIDGRGKFLIPGLWDMHVHLAKAGASSPGLFVANGVTSVRDMGGDFAVVRRWRDEIAAGVRVGPRIR